MMSRPFFSYEAGNSRFHKLDPRVKIIGLMILSPIIFGSDSLLLSCAYFTVFVAVIAAAGVRLKKLFASVRPMYFFIMIVFLLQLFFVSEPQNFVSESEIRMIHSQVTFDPDSGTWLIRQKIIPDVRRYVSVEPGERNATTPGDVFAPHPMERDIFIWGPIHPSLWNLYLAVMVALKFITLLLLASLVTSTTPQSHLIRAVDKLISPLPLKRTGLTSHDVALMAFLTIRFIPHIVSSSTVITAAALSRGLVIRKTPIRYIRVLSAALVGQIIDDAGKIAMAMENRGYGGKEKTFYHEMTLKTSDIVCLAVLGALLAAYILSGFMMRSPVTIWIA